MKKNQSLKSRSLRVENLEDRMLLAVTAGFETGAALDTALVGAAQPTGNIIEVTTLSRAAIANAISSAQDGDTIHFANTLSGQTYNITKATEVQNISKNITIDGNGVIFSATDTFSRAAFVVKDDASVTFQNFTFNSFGAGAIQANTGSVTAVDCVFTANRSSFSVMVGMTSVPVGGGAIGVYNGNVSVTNCTFDGNVASCGGAIGVYNSDTFGVGTITVADSVFTTNTANQERARGGAVQALNANVTVSNSIFDHNSAVLSSEKVNTSLGGAIYAEGNITVDNSSFTWNDASNYYRDSDGDYDWGFGAGGAIFTRGAVAISNSLVVNNRAGAGTDYYAQAGAGAGIYAGTIEMRNCTVALNTSKNAWGGNLVAGSGNVYNSIIAMAHVNNPQNTDTYSNNTLLDQASLHSTYVSDDNFANNVGFKAVIEDGDYRFATWGKEEVQSFGWDFTLVSSSIIRDTGDNDAALTTDGTPIAFDLVGADRIIKIVEPGCYEIVPSGNELPAPENLTAVGGADSITASWDAVDGAAGYTIRWQRDGSTTVREETLEAGTTSYTLTGLSGRRTYTISVNALGDDVTSTDSVFTSVKASTDTPETSYVVTSLADSGEGTLRDILAGLNSVEHATITFAGGLTGTVYLESAIEIAEGVWADINAAGITFTTASGSDGGFSAFEMNSGDYDGGFFLTGAKITGFDQFGIDLTGPMSAGLTDCIIENTQIALYARSGVALSITGCELRDNFTAAYQGAGINTEYSTVQITDSSITGNTAYSQGGGCFFWNSDVTITNTTVAQNVLQPKSDAQGAGTGAGICATDSKLTIIGSSILENYAATNNAAGAGIYVDGSSSDLKVLNTLIAGNRVERPNGSADGNGGGLYVYAGTAVLSNTQIIGNYTNGNAGAAIVLFGNLTMYNCTVAGNAALAGAGGILIGDTLGGSLGGVYNSVISANTSKDKAFADDNISNLGGSVYTGAFWCLYGSDLTAGGGAVVASGISLASQVEAFTAPNYADMTQTLYKAWDFMPKEGAAIVDAGSNGNAVDPFGEDLTTDYRGAAFTRIFNGTVDVGAYEWQNALPELSAPSITNSTRANYISFGANRHQLQWTAVDGAVAYEVSYTEDGTAWKTVRAVDTKAVITGLTYGADVRYKVKALGGSACADSDWSAVKTFNVCPMDINGDGEIAGTDRALLAKGWMAEEGDDEYAEYADINADGEIAAMDRTYIANNWMSEAGDDDLVYPRPVRAAAFADFASDLDVDLGIF